MYLIALSLVSGSNAGGWTRTRKNDKNEIKVESYRPQIGSDISAYANEVRYWSEWVAAFDGRERLDTEMTAVSGKSNPKRQPADDIDSIHERRLVRYFLLIAWENEGFIFFIFTYSRLVI